MRQTDHRCTVRTHSLPQLTDRYGDWPAASSILGRQDCRLMYNQILPRGPDIRPSCITSDRSQQHSIAYCQLHARNRRYSITASGWIKTAAMTARRCQCCYTKHKAVDRCQQSLLKPSSQSPNWRPPSWQHGSHVPNQDRAVSQHQTGC